MKTFLLILIASSLVVSAKAQNKENQFSEKEDQIFTTNIDVPPEFKGGMDKFYSRLERIPYTWSDRASKHQGRVTVLLVVEKDGSLSNLKVIHGFSEKQDNEILRVIRSLNKWKPGMQNGRAVRVLCSIPINFKLRDLYGNG